MSLPNIPKWQEYGERVLELLSSGKYEEDILKDLMNAHLRIWVRFSDSDFSELMKMLEDAGYVNYTIVDAVRNNQTFRIRQYKLVTGN